MVAAAASVSLTSGIRRGLVFSAVAFGSTTTAILVGQYLTDGGCGSTSIDSPKPRTCSRGSVGTPVLFDTDHLLVPVALCLLYVAFRRRLSRGLFYWASMAATGLATAAVGSATQGAYDNAYIPAVYFGALLSAACAVELPALAAGSGPRLAGLLVHRGQQARIVRIFSLLGLGLLSAHAMARWLDPSPHVPTPQDRAEARRLLAYLIEQGPEIFVPGHPCYSVLAKKGTSMSYRSTTLLWPARSPLTPAETRPSRIAFAGACWTPSNPGDGRWSSRTTAPRLGFSGSTGTTASSRTLPEVGRPLGP
jgi:hypothetical protein